MNKADTYRAILPTLADWDPYLLGESGLPGPRGNLELAQVVAELGRRELFEHLLTFTPDLAPTNTPGEFLAFCGVVGLGKLIAAGQCEYFASLRNYASDPRWRIREGVAMALQRVGEQDMALLLKEMDSWSTGNWLEKRAVAAGLAEPKLLTDQDNVLAVLLLLDLITASLLEAEDRRESSFQILKQGLGYCWSVAVAAFPSGGKPYMEKWLSSPDKDIRWIMKENLKKKRLNKMDPQWVADSLAQL